VRDIHKHKLRECEFPKSQCSESHVSFTSTEISIFAFR